MARYIRSFPQTKEFIERISDLLVYLLPHYIEEGKSYLTISFGCTGGHHRSVMIANEIRKRLAAAGYPGQGNPSRRDQNLSDTSIAEPAAILRSSKLEWLETNGTGAFAMGTVAGRQHAALSRAAGGVPPAAYRALRAAFASRGRSGRKRPNV